MNEIITIGEYLQHRPPESAKSVLDITVESRLRMPAHSALEIELEKILMVHKEVDR